MTHNLWYWVLNTLKEFLLNFLLPFLPRHVDWQIADTMVTYGAPILGLVFLTAGSFLHLGTLVRIIGLLILVESVKGLLAARRILARMVKLATLIGLLG